MNSTGNTAGGSAVDAIAGSLDGRVGGNSVSNNESSIAAAADALNVDIRDNVAPPMDGLDNVDSADAHDSQELFEPR